LIHEISKFDVIPFDKIIEGMVDFNEDDELAYNKPYFLMGVESKNIFINLGSEVCNLFFILSISIFFLLVSSFSLKKYYYTNRFKNHL